MSSPEQKAKLKEWKAAQKESARSAFPLPSEQLHELFSSLEEYMSSSGCNHTLTHTVHWLTERNLSIDTVVPWLEDNGGYCDCEVLANVEQHVEENE